MSYELVLRPESPPAPADLAGLPVLVANPPPALSARGTATAVPSDTDPAVSIHPPLCRRGERFGADG
jgi:hypothetical protein